MSGRTSPRWGKQATELVGTTIDDFKKNLRMVTLRVASFDQADSVDQKHVRQAFEFLARIGLERTPFWKRPQIKVTGASVVWAAMLAVPDYAPVFFTHQGKQDAAVIATMIIFGLSGLALYIWSWTQNRL